MYKYILMITVIGVCNGSTKRQVFKLLNVLSGRTEAAGRSQALQVLGFLEIPLVLHTHPSGCTVVPYSVERARKIWQHLTAIKPLAVIMGLT